MEQQKKHDIALMKYSAIAPVISGLPAQYKSFSEYFREVSERASCTRTEACATMPSPPLPNGTNSMSKTVLTP